MLSPQLLLGADVLSQLCDLVAQALLDGAHAGVDAPVLGLELPGGLAEVGLQVLEPLLDRGVHGLPSRLLSRQVVVDLGVVPLAPGALLRKAAVEHLDLAVRLAQLPRVPVGGVPHDLLEVVQPLPHGRVVRLEPHLLARQRGVLLPQARQRLPAGLALRQAAVQGVDLRVGRLDRLLVLVRRVADRPLQVREAVVDRGLLLVQLRVPHLQVAAGLGVLLPEGVDRLCVLVHAVAERALEEVDTLLQSGVVRLELRLLDRHAGMSPLQVNNGVALALAGRQASEHLVHLAHGALDGLRMLLGRVSDELLQVVHALCQRCVVAVARPAVAEKLGVSGLVRLELLHVLLRVVADHALQALDALRQRGVAAVARVLLRRQLLLHGAVVGVACHALVREAGLELVQPRVQRGPVLHVLLGGVSHVLLDEGEALLQRLQRRVLGVLALDVAREPVQLPRVLLRGVADEALDVGQALLHGGAVGLARLLVGRELVAHYADVRLASSALLRDPAVQLLDLGVGGRQLLGVPVGRVAERALQVVQALRN
mmetsp:Transcript_88503/g.280064  ORF Transcript_88503/g.280064 Transcript_88503/m.280064 type:complete len:541 (+) Transcript_88503:1452-3074(+)